jgi:tRNA(Ile)-lysidine synthetase-like protein
MSTTIIEFWKENRAYWITPPSKQKEVDKLITDKFLNYPIENENMIGKIIYFDQFYRHFCRHGLIPEDDVTISRNIATKIVTANYNNLKGLDEIEIIFALMPFKHLRDYDFIFNCLHNHWLPTDKHIIDYPDLERFYIDTYKKAFTLDTVRANLITEHSCEPYDANLICDYYPDKYNNSSWSLEAVADNKLLPLLKTRKKVIVSLSGGVDSMVMLSLLKYNRADVSAVHIVYGNRKESEHEYRLLAEFCSKLGVPFFVYRIKWLRRGEIDRQFYEDMTRDLRFAAYKAVNGDNGVSGANAVNAQEPCVIMGHIKDDVIENIWTNIAHCHHLGNLKKMEASEVHLGVRIMRPLLMVEKADIYHVSKAIGIPYLKNTTPSWSNRGKFREHFHTATVAQFGESIDSKIIEFASAIETQNKLLNMLLYEPIYSSFKNNTVNITTAIKANLDATSWINVFEHICHKYLERSKPSIKCVRDFTVRLSRWSGGDKFNIEMGKGFKIQIIKTYDSQYIMEFIRV